MPAGKVVLTPDYASSLKELKKAGKKGKDAIRKADAAATEAQREGMISSLRRTKHGESRLPDIEKYDLGDGYRLVVQLTDGKSNTRAFFFVGTHDDAEHWLERHRKYRWTKHRDDSTLELVQHSDSPELDQVRECDLESPPELLDLPLLRDIPIDKWEASKIGKDTLDAMLAISSRAWETDPDSVLSLLGSNVPQEVACLFIDLFSHAHRRQWHAMLARLDTFLGKATVATPSEAAAAMLLPANSELFVTWEEAATIPDHSDWLEWMLFLHPAQKDLVTRKFTGPARLRGVSGSGKTIVMIHRARHLAKTYKQAVGIVSLTESTRKLLDELLDSLCGVERALIRTVTMGQFVRNAITSHSGTTLKKRPLGDRAASLQAELVAFLREHPDFPKTPFRSLDENALRRFLADEIAYIKCRLTPEHYDEYLARTFKRRGLRHKLTEAHRRVCLDALQFWDGLLAKSSLFDPEGFVQWALELTTKEGAKNGLFRCVLVDEVQDLSQTEVSLLAQVTDGTGARLSQLQDGLFLVGDGAQSIYNRGFSLSSVGINVVSRSFVFKKNYRNSKEILVAAYGLIRAYEFADIDEDNLQKPLEPDLAARHGEKPYIVKCPTSDDEARFVACRIKAILEDSDRQGAQICVIGVNPMVREAVTRKLKHFPIPYTELREDVTVVGDRVKISTIESAKGHEFSIVFVVGLSEGAIPRWGAEPDEIPREASRLYVAMTRARDELYLTYSARERPSPLLAAIQADCTEHQLIGDDVVAARQ